VKIVLPLSCGHVPRGMHPGHFEHSSAMQRCATAELIGPRPGVAATRTGLCQAIPAVRCIPNLNQAWVQSLGEEAVPQGAAPNSGYDQTVTITEP
jgi:hypothetical protein